MSLSNLTQGFASPQNYRECLKTQPRGGHYRQLVFLEGSGHSGRGTRHYRHQGIFKE